MRSTRLLLGVLVALVALVAFGLMGAPAVVADPVYLPSPGSGATATQLNLADRHGYLNVILSVGVGDQVVGLTVTLPAAGGTWHTDPARSFSAPGLTCVGHGLGYTCLTAYDPDEEQPYALVPVGKYPISLPISRPTGAVDGITSSIGLTRAGTYGDPPHTGQVDTFGVLNRATDAQSTAEVRELSLQPSTVGALYTATLNVQVQIAAGENVTGVYVSLPITAGGITAYTVASREFSHGIACGEDSDYPASADAYVISCHDTNLVWQPGSYTLNLHVASIGYGGGQGTVEVRHLNGSPKLVDDFTVQQYFNF